MKQQFLVKYCNFVVSGRQRVLDFKNSFLRSSQKTFGHSNIYEFNKTFEITQFYQSGTKEKILVTNRAVRWNSMNA